MNTKKPFLKKRHGKSPNTGKNRGGQKNRAAAGKKKKKKTPSPKKEEKHEEKEISMSGIGGRGGGRHAPPHPQYRFGKPFI